MVSFCLEKRIEMTRLFEEPILSEMPRILLLILYLLSKKMTTQLHSN